MSRWVLHSSVDFDARHALTLYEGRAETPHDHRWRVAVRVATAELNHEGYALDFHRVHRILQEWAGRIVGTDLNRHPAIGTPSPTAERVAQVVTDELGPAYAELGGQLVGVSVWEGPDNRVDLELD